MNVQVMNAPTLPGVKDSVPAEEWEARVDLAALLRLVADNGMEGIADTFASVRLPGDTGHFLINPAGMMLEEVTASNLMRVDAAGEVALESPNTVNADAARQHAAIYAARPDVRSVVQTRSMAGEAFSSIEADILPLAQSSMYFYQRCGHHPWEEAESNLDEPERLARNLGGNRGLIMHNCGLLVAAPTIPSAWAMIYQIERICEFQLQAMAAAKSAGVDLKLVPEDVATKTVEGFDQTFQNCADGKYDFDWPAYLAALDRTDDSFRH